MEKLKELDNQQLAIATAVAIGALGLVGIVVGNNVVGIIMLVLQLGIAYVAISSIKGKKSSGNKNDKYRKLFMNLPIGFAQAKIITDHAGAVVGYQMVDANEKFGTYFNLDQPDYQDKILGESNIEVLQDINAWFSAYNNSGTREGDLMDVEITMEKLLVDTGELAVAQGDMFLLATDGLMKHMTDEEIAQQLCQVEVDPAHSLVQTALNAGGRDNVTVVVVSLV